MKGLMDNATAALLNSDIGDLDPDAARFVRDAEEFSKLHARILEYNDPSLLRNITLMPPAPDVYDPYYGHGLYLRAMVRFLHAAMQSNDPAEAFKQVARALKAGAHKGSVRPDISWLLLAVGEVNAEVGYADKDKIVARLASWGHAKPIFDSGGGSKERDKKFEDLIRDFGFRTEPPASG